MKKIRCLLLCLAALLLQAGFQAEAAEKQTIYNSPYVSFSPDGKAWTTNAGDQNYVWYAEGTRVSTGISSSLRSLQAGEHYYKEERSGEVPIGYWQVEHRPAQCIHNGYPETADYHGITYGRKKCLRYYYSGWTAYCADCGEPVADMLMYMSRAAAESIDYLDLDVADDIYYEYYYLCPFCTNLEQGAPFSPHKCKAVSWNQYRVRYEPNTGFGIYGGYMTDSIHMYNNAEEYEGEAVTPVTHLTANAYTRTGWEFTGWNTEPDGSGAAYGDGAEIWNLSSADWKDEGTWTAADDGTVILYAQWRPSSSTLVVDAAGGTYQGKDKISITKKYLSIYTVDNQDVTAPAGFTVSFETNGGKEIEPIQGTQHFLEWSINADYKGDWYNNVYTFIAPDGNTDTLEAVYAPDAIILPTPEKPGSSFGGWYRDPECTQPAGAGGDEYMPSRDETLYAQWVELVLAAEDNYEADGGKGAVDLSWTQADGKDKSYLLYQSRDGHAWTRINTASDIANDSSVHVSFPFRESAYRYTVPYTGIYTLTALGAQGGGYGGYAGGYGGSVSGTFWLQQGEVVTCVTGGQGGQNGGGAGTAYGNGGGFTILSSDRKGPLLTAGGGGGASPSGNGGPGGSSAGVTGAGNPSGTSGAGGMAGGGGGYQGGSAGEHIIHEHADECFYVRDLSYTYSTAGMNTISGWGLRGARRFAGCTSPSWVTDENGMTESSLIPTKGNPTLEISLHVNAWSNNAMQTYVYVTVYDSSRRQIYSWRADEYSQVTDGNPGESWEDGDGWHGTPDVFDIETVLSVDVSGTDGVWVAYGIGTTSRDDEGEPWAACHYGYNLNTISLSGGVEKNLVCGYTQGQVVSSRPAYGGSSWANGAYALSWTQQAGVQAGNGSAQTASQAVGFQESLSLAAVSAPDLAAPGRIKEEGIQKEALDGNRVTISWQEPEDNGTDYYHRAESYLRGSVSLLCTSNITKNTLTSGIAGYYYVLDTEEETAAGAGNGSFTADESLTVQAGGQVQYLHVAAVDRAGNIGETAHIRIDAGEVLWKLYTRQLSIEEADNVYPAGREKTWYVRADGSTPFTLHHSAYMDGTAGRDYQINYTIFQTRTEKSTGRNIVFTPGHDIEEGVIRTEAEGLAYTVEGQTLLGQYPYIVTERSSFNRELYTVQKFTLDRAAHGQQIEVTPMAGAAHAQGIQYTEESADRLNGIVLIGDGEAPVVNGTEILEALRMLDREKESVTINLSAEDDLSGVKEMYVEVYNLDNFTRQTYAAGENHQITLEITKEEAVFTGDFMLTVFAADNVGNIRELSYDTTEFALQTELKRILEPHDPVFQRGESGILTVTAFGYVDRIVVEFPDALEAERAYSTEFVYDSPEYVKEEQIQFMVPLYAEERDDYVIKITAYKNGEELVSSEPMMVVSGTVLDDFRTRLR